MWYNLMQESRCRAETPSLVVAPLADPPTVKELLRGEVKMLLQNLREKASSDGRSVLTKFNLFEDSYNEM